jgi:hypothetical protein
MGVDSRNPLYDELLPDWEQMRDTYRGERIVKQAGFKYLPATSGMIADGIHQPEQLGYKAYAAYRTRARFPDVVREAVEALIGVMHRKPPTIELPERMEFLRENATARNESLAMLLRRINEEQLVTGRVGLLADVAEVGLRADEPYISLYGGERCINWDEGRSDGIEIQNLNFVSIDETELERVRDFEWEETEKYRVLLLTTDETDEAATTAEQGVDPTIEAGTEIAPNLPRGVGVYRMGVFRDTNTTFNPANMFTPRIMGRALEGEIPFVFVNTKDITPEPDDPPLLGLSNLGLAIYRGEADYRQSLFMQGQDTLVVIGSTDDEDTRVGAGATIRLPVSGDAKYIGVDSSGLSEQREALVNDYTRAGQKGGELLDMMGTGQASGEALRIRVAARTATLTQVALAGAFGLEQILKITARWMGLNDEQVVVIPNLDFADDRMAADELVKMMTAKQLGAPISLESIHVNMQERGMTDLGFEEELDKIEGEQMLTLEAPTGSSDVDGPEDDEDDETNAEIVEDEDDMSDEETEPQGTEA